MSVLRQSIRIALLTAPLLLSLAATTVEAGTRERTRTGPNGRQVHTLNQRAAHDGHYSSSTVKTLPNGKQATRVTEGNVDRAAGTWDRSTTATGPNGKQRSVEVQGQRTDSGYTRHAVHTGPNGGQTIKDTEVVRTENGYTKDVTVTGPNGGVTTKSKEVVRTNDGRSVNSTVTAPNGKVATRESQSSYDPTTKTLTRETTATGFDGKTVTTTTERTHAPAP